MSATESPPPAARRQLNHDPIIQLRTSPRAASAIEECAWRWYEGKRRQHVGTAPPTSPSVEVQRAWSTWATRYAEGCYALSVPRSVEAATRATDELQASWQLDRLPHAPRTPTVMAGLIAQFVSAYTWHLDAEQVEHDYRVAMTLGGELCGWHDETASVRLVLDYVAIVPSGTADTPRRTCVVTAWRTSSYQLDEVPKARDRWPRDRDARWGMLAASLVWPDCDDYVWRYETVPAMDATDESAGRASLSLSRKQVEKWQQRVVEEMREAHDRLGRHVQRNNWPATPSGARCETCQFGPVAGDDTCPHYRGQAEAVDSLMSAMVEHDTGEYAVPTRHDQRNDESEDNDVQHDTGDTTDTSDANGSAVASMDEQQQAPPQGWELTGAAAATQHFKCFIYGEQGTFKTRSVLTAFTDRTGTPGARPRLALIDTEDGAEQYTAEFLMYRRAFDLGGDESQAMRAIVQSVESAVGNLPEGAEALAIDSFTIYCDAVRVTWKDTYLRRELQSKGNKRDYYTLQPRDYANINEQIQRLVMRLVHAPHHVIITAQAKTKYADGGEMMRADGETFDAYKRAAYYFDTVVYLAKDAKGRVIATTEKDRTNRLPSEQWVWSPETFAQHLGLQQPRAQPVRHDPDPTVALPHIANDGISSNGNGSSNGSGGERGGYPGPDAEDRAQFDRIRELREMDTVGYDERLAAYGVTSAKQLSREQRAELIESMQGQQVPF